MRRALSKTPLPLSRDAPFIRIIPKGLVGGTLQGLWGMLLAVPVAAAVKVILLHLWDTRSQWPPRMAVAPEDGRLELRTAAASLPAD